MEDAADAVVPLRPGFDIQMRGFNRSQVIEHLELLEDQLKIVSIDRNEAVQLNSDLRKLCDDLRANLTETEQRLHRIESSDTGLPVASQRVQNMLSIAEEEVQTLRNQATRQAEIIRGTAENEARELIEAAEQTARDLRTSCAELVADIERRRDELRREHAKNLRDLRIREQQMRQAIRGEYKLTVGAAEEEANQLLASAQQRCAFLDEQTERQRLEALEEIERKRIENEELRLAALSALEQARSAIGSSADTLRSQTIALGEAESPQDWMPGQRDNAPTLPMERTNGSPPAAGTPDTVRSS